MILVHRNLDHGQVLGILTGHTDVIHALAFAADGRTLASASGDGTIRVCQIRSAVCRAP
jgi:WD40 repeat protein